ncbi:hypothetical protein [Geotoga petraea]|uniref:Uncharacterized protein n=1 Tax=Geotoga petraea TaxID=28234 RepID=A0A4Z0W570_9BACT|nr:hypothetical protein [Geotoga petraea]TGG88966.1 hypothetical protein E4650_01860 [Geotoga petraea]
MKKIIIFSALIISIILVFNSCTTGFNNDSITLSLSLTNDDSKSYVTDIPLEFILKINLPLANNSLSGFYLEVSSDNGVVNNERYTTTSYNLGETAVATEINAQVIDSKTVKITYTPEFSGKYIFTGYYQLANNPEISSNSYEKDIIGVNNKIGDIELLTPENSKKRVLENETEFTWVIGVNENPKINLDLDLEDSVTGDIRIEKENGEQKRINEVSDHQYTLDSFESAGFYRLKVKLFDSSSEYSNIVYDTEDVIFIVSDDQNKPEIEFVRNDKNEIIEENNITVETLSDLYNVTFNILDEEDFGNSGIYSIKATVASGDSTEVVFKNEIYPYGTFNDTISLNLDTDIQNHNIKIIVEDYVGERTIENYSINIKKISSETNLEPRYLDNEILEYDYSNKVYNYEGGQDNLVNLVSEIITNKEINENHKYFFKITDRYGELIGRKDRDGNIVETFEATRLSQNSYTFSGYQLSEGYNLLNLQASIYSPETGEIFARNQDSINVFVEDITPPKIYNAIIKVEGQQFEIDPPNIGNVNYIENKVWRFEITIQDTSDIVVNTDELIAEIIDPNGNNILDNPLSYTLEGNKLIITQPNTFSNTLVKGMYEIKISRESYDGTVQIEDEYDNSIDVRQNYIIKFEVN